MWFSRKVTLYQKKDKETWQRIRDALRSAGLKGVRASSYNADSLRPSGCCSHLDPRNFGAGGYIDRDIYVVEVRKEDEQRAKSLLVERGIDAVVEADPVGRLGRM